VAYLLSKELKGEKVDLRVDEDVHLELAALGTVADLVPLTGANRTIVKYGLEKLAKTKRPGLLHLFKQAKLERDVFTTYDVGFVIAPRLNAAGRIESAMDSLRLLCTNNFDRAEMLAEQLELTNRERQLLMKAAAEHAKDRVIKSSSHQVKRLLFVADESYPQGVIGLVAGKLVEEFYRPSIVISVGEIHSKASVRSVNGFNIIDFLRGSFDDFVNIGGHPMAAGFTVETAKLQLLQERLEQLAAGAVDDAMLTRSLKVDCALPLSVITSELYAIIQQLAPFGMGNQEPTFVSHNVIVDTMRILGKDGTHLKLVVRDGDKTFDAIAFKMAEKANEIQTGDAIDLVYTVDTNTWNGKTTLQLKVKDIRLYQA
jgi:single-stranded-DNA-specific exonuclease